MAICLLDQNTINQIAAGEVIERPAAVVKELVENAIDAGASLITVEIREGGLSYIRITDNGSGIPREEIPIAFCRHSTSKIRSAEDLLHISSLGFRGEALSSIAAVAQVELITKSRQDEEGSKYTIEGGEEKSLTGTGCPDGTTFVVRNLFYHTPARRKFLKTPATEAGYIADVMERMALSHPEISFAFLSNNQKKMQTPGNGNTLDVIYQICGREITKELIEVKKDDIRCGMDGFIGKPVISRGNRSYMNYFINGRYIKSPVIQRAIEDAYSKYTMLHRYPFVVLNLRIDSECIDVNVHPTKMEIRFSNQDEVYRMVYHTIEGALQKPDLIPQVELVPKEMPPELLAEKKEERKHEVIPPVSVVAEPQIDLEIDRLKNLIQDNTPLGELFQTRLEDTSPTKVAESKPVPVEPVGKPIIKPVLPIEEPKTFPKQEVVATPVQETLFDEPFITDTRSGNYRLIGQVFATYWLVEYNGELLIMDQHAAHEKILYEKLVGELAKEQITSQSLTPPVIVTLSMKEEACLRDNETQFKQIGFEVEPFGGREYAITQVPAYLPNISMKEMFVELLDTLVERERYQTADLLLAKVASLSCKAAVKGNHTLSFTEAEALVEQLLQLEQPYHCPHGRPTMIRISKSEMERKFKRQLSGNKDSNW